MAAAFLALIPVVILFMIIEKELVQGLAGGAVKVESELKNTVETTDRTFNFQWHITDRCNLRCHHCYQSEYSQEQVWIFCFQ